MVMEVPGKRRRGRPKRRSLDKIRNDLHDLSERERRERKPGLNGRDHKKQRPKIKVAQDEEEEGYIKLQQSL